VSREDVLVGTQELEVELEAHIQFVIDAMQRVAGVLGLAGVPRAPEASAGAGGAAEPASSAGEGAR
jgi:hypothetical protein